MKRLKHALAARIVPIANTLRFAVGRDRLGHWIALELQGRGGGFFRSREAALHYAVTECGGRRSAVRLVRRPLLLSL
ncbi:hypothetical protein [Ancylobacter defluvii]|uniref:Uncharacterized protein n=1 Tax=Ancylobacter defluvii TaxID=1282440 RepID=A0A9W6JXA4_9HYPH|nr:hypothetical protein [Ancylobacter defluvii]MBS7585839.1 hypothetical protein [Ancylobacter defluvii]GLK84213.1 hypothetical protein GCM10017653_22830 [Ancylobacter defluvii]